MACEPPAQEQAGSPCGQSASAVAYAQFAASLAALAQELTFEVATSCRAVAAAGSLDDAWDGASTPTASDVDEVCALARQSVVAARVREWSWQVVEPSVCEAELSILGQCMAECMGEPSCENEAASACAFEELSVLCEGICKPGAMCEGSGIECEGNCRGRCSGLASGCAGVCTGACAGDCGGTVSTEACDDTCVGSCEGECSGVAEGGTCEGVCAGACEVTSGGYGCPSGARCVGGCWGTTAQPRCRGYPSTFCGASAQCSVPCLASMQAQPICSAARVEVRTPAEGDGIATSTLAAGMSGLQTALARCEYALSSEGVRPTQGPSNSPPDVCADTVESWETSLAEVAAVCAAASGAWNGGR